MKRLMPNLVAAALVSILTFTGLSSFFFNGLTEYRFNMWPRQATGDVVLVAIDAKSIKEINVWPWPRSTHGNLIKNLEQAGAAEIAFDIDFSSPTFQKQDKAFGDALKSAKGSIILASFRQSQRDYNKKNQIFTSKPLPEFAKHAWLTSVSILPEQNGQIQSVPYGDKIDGEFIPSMSSLLSGTYQTKLNSFFIDYSIKANSVPVVSYVDVLNGKIKPSFFENKKIIVGATATELGDHFVVPSQGIISGPMLQVLATETLLQNREVTKTSLAISLLGVLFIAIAVFFSPRKQKLKKRIFLFLFAAFTIEITALSMQIIASLSINTSHWHTVLLVYFTYMLLHELDLRKFLAQVTKTELVETQLMFEQVIKDSFTGIIIANENGIIQTASNAAKKILKSPETKTISGANYKDILPPAMIEDAKRILENNNDQPSSLNYASHTTLERPDNDPIVLEYIITISTINQSSENADNKLTKENVITFSFQDITSRHKAEVAQKQATEAAIKSNKAKTEFLGTMSHELRTPLNSILGFSELIKNQPEDKIDHTQYVDFATNIHQSGQQLLNVVNNILHVTRLESGSVTLNEHSCDVIEIIECAIDEVAMEHQDRPLNISFEHREDLPELYADENLCRQIMVSLLSNAIKFSDEEDEVIIMANLNQNNEIYLSVSDKGVGISRHEIENIMKPFYQVESHASRHYEGSGLGLTTANAYIELHDGHLEIDSKLGFGTTMNVIFPANRTNQVNDTVIDMQQAVSDIKKSA